MESLGSNVQEQTGRALEAARKIQGAEAGAFLRHLTFGMLSLSPKDLARQLHQQQEVGAAPSRSSCPHLLDERQELATCLRDRNELHEHVEKATTKFREMGGVGRKFIDWTGTIVPNC